jgi:Arc/MetJ-type ribon-helix-helix transcriptional regulator
MATSHYPTTPRDKETARITVRFPTEMVEHIEFLVENGIYNNRSQAIRHAVDQLNHQNTD